MLILIAESKTMHDCDNPVAIGTYTSHRPYYEEYASKVMNRIADMTAWEISNRLKCSRLQANKIAKMAYEFPNKVLGMPAIEAFSGVVYKAFDYASLTESEKLDAINRIGIISSLYGWLRPDNVIKKYRLEFNATIAPDDKRLYDFWRKDVTISLVRKLQKDNSSVILNLLPNDAAKCVDWKLVKRFAKVVKVDFKEIVDGGEFGTPKPTKLKTMRGELLRAIISRNIMDPSELRTLSTDNLAPLNIPLYPDHIAFCS